MIAGDAEYRDRDEAAERSCDGPPSSSNEMIDIAIDHEF
jgi:hypothetical protein